MNILLIYPEFPDTFWSFKHALKFTRKKAVSPPLGLLTVAALLPPEWTKRLVDVNTTKLTAEDLAWADYVFISGMTGQSESARHIIARSKPPASRSSPEDRSSRSSRSSLTRSITSCSTRLS